MRAKTQYNDLIGTVAADISDFMPESYCRIIMTRIGIWLWDLMFGRAGTEVLSLCYVGISHATTIH